MQEIYQFLIVYDADYNSVISIEQFKGDDPLAVKKYGERERENWGNSRRHVVLLGADSLQTLKHTHGNYFNYVPAAPWFARFIDSQPKKDAPELVHTKYF